MSAQKTAADEWTQLKLLTLLLVAFFSGSLAGFGMFRAVGADALLLPAIAEGAMTRHQAPCGGRAMHLRA